MGYMCNRILTLKQSNCKQNETKQQNNNNNSKTTAEQHRGGEQGREAGGPGRRSDALLPHLGGSPRGGGTASVQHYKVKCTEK